MVSLPPTATAVTSSDSGFLLEKAVAPPTRGEVVMAIRKEALSKGVRSNDQIASQFLGLLEKAVEHVRDTDYFEHYTLTRGETTTLHRHLDAIMPDEVEIPPPNSAHESIVRYLAKGSELSVVHTGTEGEFDDVPGSAWYCQIMVTRQIAVTTA